MLFVSPFDGSDEAVAKFRHRLDKMGNLSRISENFAQTIDDGIETGVEIHKGVGRPYGAAEFFAGEQLAGPFEEFEQPYEKLLLDFDAGLNTVINCLREVLRDSAEVPHFIETVPKLGYRFIASVERTDEEHHAP